MFPVFWYFQGLQNGNIDQKWVKLSLVFELYYELLLINHLITVTGGDIAQKLHLGEILPALFDDFECAKTVSADINKQ